MQQTVTIFNGNEFITSVNTDTNPTANIGLIRILAKFLAGETASIPSYLAYGTLSSGSHTPQKTDISLQGEFQTTAYERIKLYSVSAKVTEDAQGLLTFTFVDSSTNSWDNITELGIFLGVTEANMIAEYQPSTKVTKSADKSLVVEWTIALTIPDATT